MFGPTAESYLGVTSLFLETMPMLTLASLRQSLGFRSLHAVLWPQILQELYDKDVISEEAIIAWASEKQQADESDKLFVKQCEKFIQVSRAFRLSVYPLLLTSFLSTLLPVDFSMCLVRVNCGRR